MTAPTLHGDGIGDDRDALIAQAKRQQVRWQGREQILERLPSGRGIKFSVAGDRTARASRCGGIVNDAGHVFHKQ